MASVSLPSSLLWLIWSESAGLVRSFRGVRRLQGVPLFRVFFFVTCRSDSVVGRLVNVAVTLNRRNYLSGTYLESIRLKEAKSTVVVNNRVSDAATIS